MFWMVLVVLGYEYSLAAEDNHQTCSTQEETAAEKSFLSSLSCLYSLFDSLKNTAIRHQPITVAR